MGALLRYELKKIFIRKVVWLALALCAAVQLLSCYGDIRLALGGAVGGMKEVFARYEGQALTDALKARMLSDYIEYAAAHPEEFKPSEYHESGYWARDEQIWQRRHGYGVMLAYQDLLGRQTREEIEVEWNKSRDALVSGVNANGNALSPGTRRWYMRLTAQPPYVPVVHYDLGWWYVSSTYLVENLMTRTGVSMVGFEPLGILLALLLLIIGLPGFTGERTARMEPLLLTAARRRQASLAKLLAAVTVSAATALLLYLVYLLLRFAALGLNGWYLPSDIYGLGMSYLAKWAVTTLGLMLGCAAGAAIIAALTAWARSGLAALGLAAAALAAQFVLLLFALVNLRGEGAWVSMLNDAISSLPFNTVVMQGAPFGTLPSAEQIFMLFALPFTLCGVCVFGATARFLRRRKT